MPQFFTALSAIFPGGMVPGGVLIRRSDGLLVGAVGVSGDPTQAVAILQSNANLRVIMKGGHIDKQTPIH